MFHRKPKDAIMPYSPPMKNTSNKIKPDLDTGLSIDILNEMRNTQVISNYEYMSLALLQEILAKLTSIEVSCTQTAVSTEFTGRYVQNKFKWF